jgi:hypothetical protein
VGQFLRAQISTWDSGCLRNFLPSTKIQADIAGALDFGSQQRNRDMVFANTLTARRIGFAAVLAVLSASGCSHSPSADERTDAALKARGQTRTQVYPLGGKVTVDGQPADPKGGPILVVLNDAAKPDTPPRSRPYVIADAEGRFTFGTYAEGDGLTAGKYVVTFVRLKHSKKKGLVGPDQLRNLYNDPDENAKDSRFVIELPPAKANLSIDLQTQDKPAGTPGPHALTDLSGK